MLKYLETSPENNESKLQNLLAALGAQTHTPVFYILDEHNELFRQFDKYSMPKFLRQFANFLGPLYGVSFFGN